MTELLLLTIVALLIRVVGVALARSGQARDAADLQESPDLTQGLWGGSCLSLAERIFDPADYKWLYDELCFPQAARALARHRKELALSWLRALRSSFKNLVRHADSVGSAEAQGNADSSWQLLWRTLRFYFLVSYALLVVHLFGPYHRLVPYFGWFDSVRQFGLRKMRIGTVGANRTH